MSSSLPITSCAVPTPTPGYHNRFLHIDLSAEQAEARPLPTSVLRQFLGGTGLGTWLMLQSGAAELDPFDPQASIAFVFSPLVGSPVTTSAKFAVVAKSPLTGRLNDSMSSSRFAIAGKGTGFDAIVLTGQAKRPSIVVIESHGEALQVRLESAEGVWGTTCSAAEQKLRKRFGRSFSSAVIGPAGEELIPFATISHDGRHAGRGGSGAVLGAKKIKALVVAGSQTCEWADAKGLAELAKKLSAASFGPATEKYRELGTASNLLAFNRLHSLPTKNFQQGSFAAADQLAPETLVEVRRKTRAYCAACTIGCEHIYSLKSDDDDADGVRIEYENLFALGPLCGVDDADVVLQASRRCDELGLDTISVGGTISFAMECRQRGYLTDDDVPEFGDARGLLAAIEAIVQGQGIGALLRTGSRAMAHQIGGDAIDFAPQVKGLELPGYEPRALQTMALGFAVGTRGADHNRSGAYEFDFSERVDRRNLNPQSANLVIQSEDQATLIDSLILCKFLRGIFADLPTDAAGLLRLVTGWDIDADEVRAISRRIVSAKKLFNIRAGWTPAEDTLPQRFLSQPLPDDDRASLDRESLRQGIELYNQLRGWDKDGWLPESLVQELS